MYEDNKEAMAVAINNTLTSVVGSSITTVAGFIALCFMSYTQSGSWYCHGQRIVILGVIGCVTTLPSMILVLDKLLQKTSHKSLLPDMGKVASGITKVFPVFLICSWGWYFLLICLIRQPTMKCITISVKPFPKIWPTW